MKTARTARACALVAATIAVLVAAGASLALAGCGRKEDRGPVVATVNGSPIYAASLDLEMVRSGQLPIAEGGGEGASDPVRMGRMRAAALERLIDAELLYQEAVRTGHKAAKEAVDEQLSGLRGQFESGEAFEIALAELGIVPSELRRDLEHGLSIQEFVEAEIRPTVVVTPQDARAYYDSHPEQFTQPERIRARDILLEVPPEGASAAAEEARRRLEELRARVLAGEDFGALARQYSQGPSASAGGDLGWFGRGEMGESFDRAAFALSAGELSQIVITPYGYHLIQLLDRAAPSLAEFERVADQLTAYLRDQRVGEKLSGLARELRQRAEISIPTRED